MRTRQQRSESGVLVLLQSAQTARIAHGQPDEAALQRARDLAAAVALGVDSRPVVCV
jgi:hypothetical protein